MTSTWHFNSGNVPLELEPQSKKFIYFDTDMVERPYRQRERERDACTDRKRRIWISDFSTTQLLAQAPDI